ncbi:hypothetical protein DR66_4066 [Delftia acidovorans]|uniref:hypothetical protein n=1 Tax=Delftia acidovorans TaxID=80866 RepID=UPI0005064994|nr:hypothetical protein [Delftia acidovorans]KFJ12670.1 hypothetical protein DR66_4066 [Delftia acidovorans]QQB53400.1 hypothetical protein I6H54_14620 [Delftia acidovorans]
MPIRPEMRALYPANWPEIRARILARAGDRCERCKAPNRTRIARGAGTDEGTYMLDSADVYCSETGEHLGQTHMCNYEVARMVDVVLTIAHTHDPNPANCADDNLEALCQRCHNKLDAPMRAANARATRRARLAVGDLFEKGQTP